MLQLPHLKEPQASSTLSQSNPSKETQIPQLKGGIKINQEIITVSRAAGSTVPVTDSSAVAALITHVVALVHHARHPAARPADQKQNKAPNPLRSARLLNGHHRSVLAADWTGRSLVHIDLIDDWWCWLAVWCGLAICAWLAVGDWLSVGWGLSIRWRRVVNGWRVVWLYVRFAGVWLVDGIRGDRRLCIDGVLVSELIRVGLNGLRILYN